MLLQNNISSYFVLLLLFAYEWTPIIEIQKKLWTTSFMKEKEPQFILLKYLTVSIQIHKATNQHMIFLSRTSSQVESATRLSTDQMVNWMGFRNHIINHVPFLNKHGLYWSSLRERSKSHLRLKVIYAKLLCSTTSALHRFLTCKEELSHFHCNTHSLLHQSGVNHGTIIIELSRGNLQQMFPIARAFTLQYNLTALRRPEKKQKKS